MSLATHPADGLLTNDARSLASPGQVFELTKRAIDVAFALVAIAAVAPLVLACMAWIKLCDGGPVLYHQWRVGRGGWLFQIRKLRTMTVNAEQAGAQFASASDPRILPGCGWMRKSHVDELPQLLNIVAGDMSLVGPRPERPELMEELRAHLPRIHERLAGAPGLTGLAQVRNGYTNDIRGARRKLAYDLLYLRRRSVLGDTRLILATIPKLWDRTAC